MQIKILAAVAFFAIAASAADAGGLLNEIVEPEVSAPAIAEDDDAIPLWIPLLALIAAAALAAGGSGGGT